MQVGHGKTGVEINGGLSVLDGAVRVAIMFAAQGHEVARACIEFIQIEQQLRRVLTNTRRLMIFNWTMAGLLVLSLAPVLWH